AAGHARVPVHLQPAAPEGVVDRWLARLVLGGVPESGTARRAPGRGEHGSVEEDRRAASRAEAAHRSPRTARRRHRANRRRSLRRSSGHARACPVPQRRGQDVGRAELFEPALPVPEHPRPSPPDLRGVRAGPLVLGHRHHPHAVLLSAMRDDVHRGAAVASRPRPRARDGWRHRRLARLEAARGLIAGPPLDPRAERAARQAGSSVEAAQVARSPGAVIRFFKAFCRSAAAPSTLLDRGTATLIGSNARPRFSTSDLKSAIRSPISLMEAYWSSRSWWPCSAPFVMDSGLPAPIHRG